ncbi:MAG: hypothetical protein K2M17_03010, partial [Bacilli bacterium]|nr:hypothetical protein [Bacilli bacterium]
GNIGKVVLWLPYFIKESEDKYISLHVDILNKNADEGYISAFKEGIDASGEKKIEKMYTSENLNTNIILYSNEQDTKRITVTFVYDSVLYIFMGNNMSKDEMISMIENLK